MIRCIGLSISAFLDSVCTSWDAPLVSCLIVLLPRYNYKLPRYNQMMNALTWMSHAQNLKRVAREHVIDLYLRPPVTRFRLMDYHFMDRIVRDANRCALSKPGTGWDITQTKSIRCSTQTPYC